MLGIDLERKGDPDGTRYAGDCLSIKLLYEYESIVWISTMARYSIHMVFSRNLVARMVRLLLGRLCLGSCELMAQFCDAVREPSSATNRGETEGRRRES